MASAQAGHKRSVLCAALLTCMCSTHLWAVASVGSTEVALDHDTAVETPEVGDCDAVVDTFLARRSKMPKLTADSHNHMLYFLHIPRTAGRTYHACFLKLSHPPSKRCAKSYDVLRLDISVPACGLLSSHDDFSVVDNLPEDAAVITQLRDPVDRVLSAYEFAVEVAARVLNRPKDYKPDPTKVNTRDVWPWSHLVPFMEKDMLERVAAERAKNITNPQLGPAKEQTSGKSTTEAGQRDNVKASTEVSTGKDAELPPLDAYNNSLVMPVHEFIEHPVVHELLHNGGAMQILGITNYSHWPEARAVRTCAQQDPVLQRKLTRTAEKRLRGFLHVGLMERLDDSIASMAAAIGLRLDGPTWKANTPEAFSYEELKAETNDTELDSVQSQYQNVTALLEVKRRDMDEAEAKLKAERLAEGKIKDDITITDPTSDGGAPPAEAPPAPERHFSHAEDVEGTVDPNSLPDYVAPAATEEVVTVEELHDPEWIKMLQDELDTLEDEAAALKERLNITAVATQHGEPGKTGPARQVLPDDNFLQKHNVREGFMDCSDRARQRNANRKMTSLKGLSMNDGRSVEFSRSARAKLNPAVILRIRELNLMDVAIHELGRELLEDRLEQQREAEVLKPVRSPTDKKPPGGRRRERYEPSAGELAAALSNQLHMGSEPLLGPGVRDEL